MAKHELNKVNINVEFEGTANRQQLSSGDNIKTLFGKIKKWLSDLKAVAFTGSYDDLTNNPSIPLNKEDVGLGNVPNVTTNDQTPTFSRATTRANIISGEKLSVILGKISKHFYDLKTVAFSGNYNDLSNKPYLPDYRNYKQETLVFNSTATRKYVRFAYICPHTSANTNISIGLKLRACDYILSSMAIVVFGFGYYDPRSSSDGWVDWNQFKTISELNVVPTAANSAIAASKLAGKLVLVQDTIDLYCSELWIKLEPGESIHIELDYYAENYTYGSYPNFKGSAYTNVNDCEYSAVSFVHDGDLMYLDHIPTSTDIAYSGEYEDYPRVLMGDWS